MTVNNRLLINLLSQYDDDTEVSIMINLDKTCDIKGIIDDLSDNETDNIIHLECDLED